MDIESTANVGLLGLDLLSGADSFIHDLKPEDEASIRGGRGSRSRSRSRSAISRSRSRMSRSRRSLSKKRRNRR